MTAMRYPQLLVYEGDGRLAAQLRPLAEEKRWALREVRQPEACLRLLGRGRPDVLVLKLGRDLERELTFLDRVNWARPATATVVVSDTDHPGLAGLAWDLGAAYVLLPSAPHDSLTEIVGALLGAP